MIKNLALFLLFVALAARGQTGIKTEIIEYRDGETVLQGLLAYDASLKEPRPGVLVIHEWYGHNDYVQQRAIQLAEMGYIAFALDMYGKGILASNAQQASQLAGTFYQNRHLMRQRATAGLKILQEHRLVDKTRIAAIGFCFGGTVALELSRSGAELAGVVSFHGGLNTPNPADARQIKGSVLVLHGADDPYVKEDEVKFFQEEMRQAGVDWQMIFYGDAVHSFSNPAAGNDKSQGAAYHPKAAQRSWKAMQTFFSEIFEKKK